MIIRGIVSFLLAFCLQNAQITDFTKSTKDEFLDRLVSDMTVPELVLQLHIMFADNVVGPNSSNELYDFVMRFAPTAGIGIMHDWYPTNKSQYNSVQRLNSQKSRLNIPIMQFGECLHGVGSFKQSMFPQSIGMAASFDTELVHRIGRAIGAEARSIGIHACLSPVLDLGLEPRWGRVQEGWGEDTVLTSLMGVAMASGLSKNGSLSDPDAVVPVMKHFAAHGSGQGGINGAPSMVLGARQVFMDMLRPFKAVIDLGFAKGVMMAYSELDAIPSHVHPMLYKALDDWGFDGFVTADDNGLIMLQNRHLIASSGADVIQQWFNAGGMIQYYDYPLEVFLNETIDLIKSGEVSLSTLKSHVKRILGVKYDLGLFENRYILDDIDSQTLTASHAGLTLEAAQKSIVLLENKNSTLPINPDKQNVKKIALIGPFSDIVNYGDYSGQFGAYPSARSSTIRQAVSEYINENCSSVEFVSSWGSNSWEYNAQYNIPPYLLSVNGNPGGLLATYFANTEFKDVVFQQQETPNRDWGIYPPISVSGISLPSNNFSVIWEGVLTIPVDHNVDGYIGVALNANATAKLYINNSLIHTTSLTATGNILSNIPGFSYIEVNATAPPPGSTPFTFVPNTVHQIRLEYQAYNTYQKEVGTSSVNAQLILFWNLVDAVSPIKKAVSTASTADLIILAVGANWNSDGEGGDRATMSLSRNQAQLADAVLGLGIPVITVLQGGRPFAIPEIYARSHAVLNAYFPGQSGGRAISDVLFGVVNPGGRVPVTVPHSVGTLPAFYNYKITARANTYVDQPWKPLYPFGHGLSYTTFNTTSFHATITSSSSKAIITSTSIFGITSTITFHLTITNTGTTFGSYVPQIYLLPHVSSITPSNKKLVAFTRTYLEAGESRMVGMDLDVERFLPILDRNWEWVLEKGEYAFVVADSAGFDYDGVGFGGKVTLSCV